MRLAGRHAVPTSTPSPLKAPTGMVYNLANLLSLLDRYDERRSCCGPAHRRSYQYNGRVCSSCGNHPSAERSIESGASGVPSRSSQANEEEDDDDDDWFVDETVPPPPAAPASPAVNATHAVLEEAVALLHQAVAHEHAISAAAASSKGECGSSGSGGGAPPMEHAYRENQPMCSSCLGVTRMRAQAEHARALAPLERRTVPQQRSTSMLRRRRSRSHREDEAEGQPEEGWQWKRRRQRRKQ